MMSYLWRIAYVITLLFANQNYDGFVFAEEANDDDNQEEERTGTIIGIDLGTTYSEYYYFIVGLDVLFNIVSTSCV